jgi:hypothetical protein
MRWALWASSCGKALNDAFRGTAQHCDNPMRVQRIFSATRNCQNIEDGTPHRNSQQSQSTLPFHVAPTAAITARPAIGCNERLLAVAHGPVSAGCARQSAGPRALSASRTFYPTQIILL